MRNNRSSSNSILKRMTVLLGISLSVSAILFSSLNLFTNKTELSVDSKEITTPHVPMENIAAVSIKKSAAKKKKIHSLVVNPNRVLGVYGPIDRDTEEVALQITALSKQSKEPIVLLINSPGGSVLSGEKIVSAMEASRANVYTVCVGMCASMAAIIHQYGTQRLATDRSVLMFHDASAMIGGRVSEMLSILNLIKRKLEKTNRFIAERANMPYDEFVNLGANNYWIDAEDAVEKRFVDKLVVVE
jgi:ATP-dependent Clp protease protease subunit